MEHDLSQTLEDYKRWGFRISAAKTKATIFTLRKVPPNFSLQVDGASILVGRSVKILGVTLDSRLRWKDHIETIEEKCTHLLHLLRRITGY